VIANYEYTSAGIADKNSAENKFPFFVACMFSEIVIKCLTNRGDIRGKLNQRLELITSPPLRL
jgi:hypothetical protein